jgi:hypothetical protein
VIVLNGEVNLRVNNDFTSIVRCLRDADIPAAIGVSICGGVQSHDIQERHLFLRFITWLQGPLYGGHNVPKYR